MPTEKSIRFWVSDNGEGLTDEEKEIILTSPEKVINPRSQGFGLGLSIVKRILNKLDGALTVENNEINGTKFIFTLRKP